MKYKSGLTAPWQQRDTGLQIKSIEQPGQVRVGLREFREVDLAGI
jgi:hypothetical protein